MVDRAVPTDPTPYRTSDPTPDGTPDGTARTSAARPVVHGSDVHVERAHFDLPMAEARSRFGGTDVPAIVGGALAGLGTATLLGVLATSAGLTVGQGSETELAVGGLVAALVALAVSGAAAGWVAGRAARFDGARNGLLAGLLTVLLLAGLGAVAAGTAVDAGLPLSFDGGKTFQVIHSYIGHCPIVGDSTFPFKVPSDTPSGKALFAWSWFNQIGNREMYMNCASINIVGAKKIRGSTEARAGLSSRPNLFVANVGNGCTTVEGRDTKFPNPGPDVTQTSDQPPVAPVGNCS